MFRKKSSDKSGRIFKMILKSLGFGLVIIFLGTVGLDAVDHYDDLSQSIAGRIIFGQAKEKCPPDMVLVPAAWGDFCIDRYEVSAAANCPHQNPEGAMQSRENIDHEKCLPMSMPQAFPWTNISQNQAAQACAKAGKRLPSSREWSLAALGTPDHDSAWGKDDCQVADNWDKQPGLSGSGQKCVSYVGAFDLIGNVWEWVDGAVYDGLYEGRPLPDAGYVSGISQEDGFPSSTEAFPSPDYYQDYFWIKAKETRAIARGGYWNNEFQAGQYAYYADAAPSFTGKGVGFRCVKRAENGL